MDKHLDLLIRYVIAVLAVLNIGIFYFIFKPLTIWILFPFLTLFFGKVIVIGNILSFNLVSIELISACIAGSAYLLLFILNVLTPKIKLVKRIYLFLLSSAIFLVLNIIRLLISSALLNSGSSAFSSTHLIFWYTSIAFVVVIWFVCIRIFKIKEIPIYSDIKLLVK
jgi:hypothetical protein